MLRIAICDDDLPIKSEIESLLLDIMQDYCIKMDIDIFFDGKTLYQQIQSGTNFDIIYMDIEMNDVDGIQAARLIRAQNIPSILIYISAYETYFKQLFEVEPFPFLQIFHGSLQKTNLSITVFYIQFSSKIY